MLKTVIIIGILEDDSVYAAILHDLISEWAQIQNCFIQIDIFTSGEEILKNDSFSYHIFFMDIQLSNIDGVETAKEIRKKGYAGEIVFLTAFNEYVFEGYNVRALNYILKPITYIKLSTCMDVVLQSIQIENYIIRNRDIIEKIPYKDIIYILSERHYMEFVTKSKSYKHLICIKDVLKHLPSQFVRCHRTVIINVNHIQKLEGHKVIMTNKVILPVSKTYLQNVRTKLEDLVF